jgi:hypothetical protein
MTTSNIFGSTFAVFPNTQSQVKNCKRAAKPTYNDPIMDRLIKTKKKGEGTTAVWRNGGCSASYERFVVG